VCGEHRLIAGDNEVIGTHSQSVVTFSFRMRKNSDVCTHRCGKLHADVA